MSYSKTTWTDGDTITAQNLNKMENGISEAGPLIIHDNDGTMDKTWQEIYDAFTAGRACYVDYNDSGVLSRFTVYYINEYGLRISWPQSTGYSPYTTSDANGYPTYAD